MRSLALSLALSAVLLSACAERGADPDAVTPGATAPAQDESPAPTDDATAAAAPCPTDAPDPEADPDAEAPHAGQARSLRFDARQPIDACIWLRSRDDGGRRTGAFSGYHPQIAFASPREDGPGAQEATTATCTLAFEASPLEPGAGTQAALACTDAVVVNEAAPGFEIIEGGRLVGGGAVRFPPTR